MGALTIVAFIPLARRLGFINDSGIPTEAYDELKDAKTRDFIIGEKVKELYSDLYALNTNIHSASDDDIKGAISRVTGKDAASVARYLATFKALIAVAKFSDDLSRVKLEKPDKNKDESRNVADNPIIPSTKKEGNLNAQFHYNIQIHLPATTEVSVYSYLQEFERKSFNVMSLQDDLKRFVFDGLLVGDNFARLEEEGISVGLSTPNEAVARIIESDFSPKIIYNAQKMSSIYILFFLFRKRSSRINFRASLRTAWH